MCENPIARENWEGIAKIAKYERDVGPRKRNVYLIRANVVRDVNRDCENNWRFGIPAVDGAVTSKISRGEEVTANWSRKNAKRAYEDARKSAYMQVKVTEHTHRGGTGENAHDCDLVAREHARN